MKLEYFMNDDSLFLKVLNEELFMSKKVLRDSCPCARCCGETDVLGNIYSIKTKAKTSLSYEIAKVELVGSYAIQVFWKDGHSNGIYPFELLGDLNEQN